MIALSECSAKEVTQNFWGTGESVQLLFFFFMVLGFELRALHLQGRSSST
jgi:hypothetical protein